MGLVTADGMLDLGVRDNSQSALELHSEPQHRTTSEYVRTAQLK